MESVSGYILLLAEHPRQVRVLMSLLGCSSHSVAIACSAEQAVTQVNEKPPFLIILAGDHQNWSQTLLHELRTRASAYPVTLVALTDFHAPRWIHQEENPGFDGFLVSPLSSEVLSSLVQSAYTRQTCYSIG
jgi:AmiR/NasT family two-component response regulator